MTPKFMMDTLFLEKEIRICAGCNDFYKFKSIKDFEDRKELYAYAQRR